MNTFNFLKSTVYIILTCIALNPLTAHSNDDIGSDMKSIHAAMQTIFPLVVTQKSLTNSEMNIIINNVQSLQEHVGHLKNQSEKSDGFKISHSLLTNHLSQIQSALQNKEQDYALSLLREVPQMCTACHTQDERNMHFDSSAIKAKLNSDFSRGEYHFMTRDYHEALLDYNDHLMKQKKIKPEKNNAEAMEKILLIYIQIFRDSINAEMYFDRLLSSEKLSAGLAINANYWLQSLKKINYSPAQIEDIKTLETEINTILKFDDNSGLPIFISDENKVNALWIRALTYDFMNKNPKHADNAKLLYWLASLENALDYGLSYQLPEIYLKHCIVSYPTHAYAKKCYSQYQLQVEFQYTGSAGTQLPLYQKLELENLQKLIQ